MISFTGELVPYTNYLSIQVLLKECSQMYTWDKFSFKIDCEII